LALPFAIERISKTFRIDALALSFLDCFLDFERSLAGAARENSSHCVSPDVSKNDSRLDALNVEMKMDLAMSVELL
jgi:hypothetical protein